MKLYPSSPDSPRRPYEVDPPMLSVPKERSIRGPIRRPARLEHDALDLVHSPDGRLAHRGADLVLGDALVVERLA